MSSDLRTGVRGLLCAALLQAVEGLGEDRGERLATQLEACCHAAAGPPGPGWKEAYVERYFGLLEALPRRRGAFLETTLAAQIAAGAIPPAEACTPAVYGRHQKPTPRQQGRGLFYSLLRQDRRFSAQACRDFAAQIESGCYDAAIARSKESADCFCRNWDDPMFVDVYSARCGLVASNLDSKGLVARSLGGRLWALDSLASGAVPPKALGAMTAIELCAEASRDVREKIARRLEQKVDEKTSTLFACPRCHKRNHTYRQVQIGAGDEPSTFMCTCKECGENYEGFA
jgi:hypothetical protein